MGCRRTLPGRKFSGSHPAIGKKPGEPWDIEFRRNFFSLYNTFSEYFLAKGGDKLPVTTADAFLKYLEIYDYEDILKKAPAEIKEDVNRLWDESPSPVKAKDPLS